MGQQSNAQEGGHPSDFDYVEGSPHLKHPELRAQVESSLQELVRDRVSAKGGCRVLEVGAGHGEFTSVLLEAGAEVTMTEMSRPSADRLTDRFSGDDRVSIVYDPEAAWASQTQERFDLVACISVLHHIPDYVGFLKSAAALTEPGGSFVSWQDPTWYARRSRATRAAEQLAYYAWRVRQGEVLRGVKTRVRRIRGIYDEKLFEDMSEYHVVRAGVDDELLADRARQLYDDVELIRYWSTQSTRGQRWGNRWQLPTTFALVARGRKASQ